MNHFRFTATWRGIVLTLIAVVVFSGLGFWQIHRAEEKQQRLAHQRHYANQTPFKWHTALPIPQQYQRLQLQGRFLPIIWLLDNQYVDHQWGYDVIAPLRLDNGKIILVDRGWIAGYPARDRLPQVTALKGAARVQGAAYYPGKQWQFGATLDKQAVNQHTTIAVIESLNFPDLQQYLHMKIYPFILRLETTSIESNSQLIRQWPIVSMPPTRHIAYAIQWFAFALVSVIIFFGLSLKRGGDAA